jgi:hypothetical protein
MQTHEESVTHTELLITVEGDPDGRNVQTGWLIELVKHSIWADCLYFYTCCYFQFPKSYHHLSLLYGPLHKQVGVIKPGNSEYYTPSSEPFRIN